MAIIYTYPTKATPANDDLILISDSADSNKTKQVTVASIKGQTAGVTSIVAGNNVTISSTGASGTGDVTVNASGGGTFSVQDSGGTAITGIDTLDFNTNLSVSHSLGSSTVTINSSGSGPGTGTEDTVPIWSTTSTLGDSLITQNAGATVLNVGTNIASFSTTAGVGSVFATRVSVNGYSTFGGKLKLNSPDGATFVEIEGPANGGAAYTLKLPSSAPGNNQILEYTTSGNLGWINTPTDTTYNIMGSGNSYDAGLVLAGDATHNDEFLRKDGTWQATASYTEGTWTPSLTFGGGQTAPTLTVASGNYVIIGKYVYANFYVVTQAGTQYTGTLPRISIPVAAASHNGGHLMMNNAYTTTSTNTSVILGSVVGGMSIVGLKTMDVSGSEVRIQNLGTSPSTSYNNAVLTGSIIYLKS